jgi:hypothetical protein
MRWVTWRAIMSARPYPLALLRLRVHLPLRLFEFPHPQPNTSEQRRLNSSFMKVFEV